MTPATLLAAMTLLLRAEKTGRRDIEAFERRETRQAVKAIFKIPSDRESSNESIAPPLTSPDRYSTLSSETVSTTPQGLLSPIVVRRVPLVSPPLDDLDQHSSTLDAVLLRWEADALLSLETSGRLALGAGEAECRAAVLTSAAGFPTHALSFNRTHLPLVSACMGNNTCGVPATMQASHEHGDLFDGSANSGLRFPSGWITHAATHLPERCTVASTAVNSPNASFFAVASSIHPDPMNGSFSPADDVPYHCAVLECTVLNGLSVVPLSGAASGQTRIGLTPQSSPRRIGASMIVHGALHRGDTIVLINGRRVWRTHDIREWECTMDVADTHYVTVLRKGKKEHVRVALT